MTTSHTLSLSQQSSGPDPSAHWAWMTLRDMIASVQLLLRKRLSVFVESLMQMLQILRHIRISTVTGGYSKVHGC